MKYIHIQAELADLDKRLLTVERQISPVTPTLRPGAVIYEESPALEKLTQKIEDFAVKIGAIEKQIAQPVCPVTAIPRPGGVIYSYRCGDAGHTATGIANLVSANQQLEERNGNQCILLMERKKEIDRLRLEIHQLREDFSTEQENHANTRICLEAGSNNTIRLRGDLREAVKILKYVQAGFGDRTSGYGVKTFLKGHDTYGE